MKTAPNESETEMHASASERDDFFRETLAPYETFDFRIYDEFDNGEFLTSATVDLVVRGEVVETKQFVVSSEDPPEGAFSAYGNGRSNHAGTQARSYAWAWVDAMRTPMEERFAPGGVEWQREMAEAI